MLDLCRVRQGVRGIALAASLCACGISESGSTDIADGDGAVAPRVVAQVKTDEGATVTFLNEREIADDPVISIAIASPQTTPVMDALLAQQPSALELYRAIVPSGPAPDELVREHRLLARGDATYALEPRALSVATIAGSNVVDDVICGTFSSWESAFDTWSPDLDHQSESSWGVSSTVFVDYAPRFYFDVCRTTVNAFAFAVRTERRSSPSAAWSTLDDGSPLGGNQRYRFFRNSFTCTSFQYRLYVNNAAFGGGYYRGATWADKSSCEITL